MNPIVLSLLIPVLLVLPTVLPAQDHVVPPAELREAIVTASEKRQRDLGTVREFFGSEAAKEVLGTARMDLHRVENAVATLDNAELAALAARAAQVQKDFAAGQLTNQQLTYIVIALAAAVLVLVLV